MLIHLYHIASANVIDTAYCLKRLFSDYLFPFSMMIIIIFLLVRTWNCVLLTRLACCVRGYLVYDVILSVSCSFVCRLHFHYSACAHDRLAIVLY